jgi:hypothetical protein
MGKAGLNLRTADKPLKIKAYVTPMTRLASGIGRVQSFPARREYQIG